MKTLMRTAVCFTFLAAAPAWAGHAGYTHDGISAEKTVAGVEGAACADTINVKVNGLVCDFCARALEKVVGKREDVAGINVDLDKGAVVVAMKPGQTMDDDTLTQLITDSGYTITAIHKGC